MSRSRPTDHSPNPATRWYEWQGEKGCLKYYDKATDQTIEVALPFTYLLLDELATIRGWHEPSKSGIVANEVRDTRQQALAVKSWKGGPIATGLYQAIKADVKAAGGAFVANCYIAFKTDADELVIGSVQWKGAALGAWMDFRTVARPDLYEQAITITGCTEGKKGRVTYRVPTFELKAVSADTNEIARGLDATLQTYLEHYLARTTRDQVDDYRTEPDDDPPPPEDIDPEDERYDDSIPF